MKKIILLLVLCLSAFVFSCKDKAHEHSEETHTHDGALENVDSESEEMASNILYQCPMDCEKGKSYVNEGACPVCGMALKGKKIDMDSDEHGTDEHHDHDEDSDHSEHDH